MQLTTTHLSLSYKEAVTHLIPLIEKLRDPTITLKRTDIHRVFESVIKANPECWEKTDSGGHINLQNRISGVHIGYQNHGRSTLSMDVKKSLLEAVQAHLNILCNDIFGYKNNNWKTVPDYEAALARLQAQNN